MMVTIPGWMIALLTFPGTIVHEIAHRFFCDIFGIPVYEVRYFIPFSHTSGYVKHARPENIWHNLVVSMAPLLINTILCAIVTFPAASYLYLQFFHGIFIYNVSIEIGFLYLFLFWIGISIGAEAFPSNQDMNIVLELAVEECESSSTHFIIWLLSKFIVMLNFLSQIWISFIYAGLVSLILPRIVFG